MPSYDVIHGYRRKVWTKSKRIYNIIKTLGTWFNICRWTIVLMYTEYVHYIIEYSEFKLGKIKGICVMGDSYNAARKNKMLAIKKMIDLAKEILASIWIVKYETINE